MRPLWWHFPDAGDVDDQYLFGPDLLVAPVVARHATSRAVVFPGGQDVEWISLWDAQDVVKGGVTKVVEAPIDSIPVYKRAGGARTLDGIRF